MELAFRCPHLVTASNGVTTAQFFEQGSIVTTDPQLSQKRVVQWIPRSQRPHDKSVQDSVVTLLLEPSLDICVLVHLPLPGRSHVDSCLTRTSDVDQVGLLFLLVEDDNVRPL